VDNVSIHPGVEGGRRRHPLETATKPFKNKGKLAKKMKVLGRRRLAHAATLKGLPSNVNPAAFKAPGSYNAHKS
jgi:hypothetical protein